MVNITTTLVSMPTSKLEKRQAQPTESVVHVTITRAGTVVYTQTATSYSYVQSYSTITPSGTSTPNHPNSNNNNSSSNNNNSSHTNVGAIVGGVVGGVAGLALIGLAFFLYSRSQKRKRARANNNNNSAPADYYQEPHNPGMNSLSPTPRHFVAPLEQIGKHELADGADQKYYYANGNGYYEDIIAPYHYSGDNSVTSDSLPSTTVDTSIPYSNRHVPDSVDYPLAEERHVPNAKEDNVIIVEPPHTKD